MDVSEIKNYLGELVEAITARAQENATRKSVVMKKKGHQAQYDHQMEVLEEIERAEEFLSSKNSEKAAERLKNAKSLVKKRVKLIKLADRSENGWKTVDEYLSDDMADDSADEKRISRAEARAGEKRRKAFTQRVQYKRSRFDQPSTSGMQFFRGKRMANPRDTCYACGKVGHWRSFCPNLPAEKPTGPAHKAIENSK